MVWTIWGFGGIFFWRGGLGGPSVFWVFFKAQTLGYLFDNQAFVVFAVFLGVNIDLQEY
jgi:hypothetical protein